MFANDDLHRAAKNVIRHSLGLHRNQNLLIITDLDSLPVADQITAAAQVEGVACTTIYVPRLVQDRFGEDDALTSVTESALREADAVLSCLSDRAEHTAFRAKVLQTSCGASRKIAHAPGLNLEILRLADINYDQLLRRCQIVAQALILGHAIEIITVDSQGHEYCLHAESGGWEQPPGISNGVIADGEWANLPPGETFLVPHGGDGDICINGSLPGRVLAPGEELILSFVQGRCTAVRSAQPAIAQYLMQSQIAKAEAQGDENWRNLAEIGFGVNVAIEQLRGIELIDEKKAGTIHIALGRSDWLGGHVYSAIHCDLVVTKPTVSIDGKSVLHAGVWAFQEQDWLLDYRTVSWPQSWWDQFVWLRRSASRTEATAQGLTRVWGSASWRRSALPVGNRTTATVAHQIYQLLPERNTFTTKAVLLDKTRQMGLDDQHVAGLLWIMCCYDLLRFHVGDLP